MSKKSSKSLMLLSGKTQLPIIVVSFYSLRSHFSHEADIIGLSLSSVLPRWQMKHENLTTPPGTRLRESREAKKLSQKQLAHLIGVSERTISRWESGSTVPDSSDFSLLIFVLGLEVTAFLEKDTYLAFLDRWVHADYVDAFGVLADDLGLNPCVDGGKLGGAVG